MGEARDPRLHAVDERNRTIDLAERPRHERQMGHRRDAGVMAEPKCQIVVTAGLEQGERPFQMLPCFARTLRRTSEWSRRRGGRLRPRANRVSPRRR